MKYLKNEYLDCISENKFQEAEQFPWMDIPNFLNDIKYKELSENMPNLELFKKDFNKARNYNQKPHDRYSLEYKKGIEIPLCWQEFIDELHSKEYIYFLKRMYKVKYLDIRFHWHYSKSGGSISPHCDGINKIGSQLFYFNSSSKWNEDWGGQTLVLIDSDNRFEWKSAPKFNEFDKIISAKSVDNNSFIFARTNNSWHGVKELVCPHGEIRKIFVVVIDKSSPLQKIKNFFLKKKGY